MREIKFRAWDNLNKYMGDVMQYLPYAGRIGTVKIQHNGGQSYMCDEFELLQYTGLKDSKGKEIYEGDVALIFGIPSEIRYSDTWCGWVFFDKERSEELQELPFYDGENGNYKECEIIGNIYEQGNQSN